MGMSKAEMESQWNAYDTGIREAHRRLSTGQIGQAVKIAVSVWPSIDGMMQFAKKYMSQEFYSLDAFNIVLKYCPLLFDFESINRLEGFLKDQRKIDRRTPVDEMAQLQDSRIKMRHARTLWNLIEQEKSIAQQDLETKLGGDQQRWNEVVDAWVEMKVLSRQNVGQRNRLSFTTCMSDDVPAKCPSCGIVVKKRKLEQIRIAPCSKCNSVVSMVLLRE